jgi:hypothetical protein
LPNADESRSLQRDDTASRQDPSRLLGTDSPHR